MRTINNRIVLDLSKVQHGSFWYVNQEGQVRRQLPIWSRKTITKGTESGEAITVHNQLVIGWELAAPHPDYPGETLLERACRLDIIDIWKPVCTFQLTANHNVTYTGKKAIVMWKTWNERIFNKKK